MIKLTNIRCTSSRSVNPSPALLTLLLLSREGVCSRVEISTMYEDDKGAKQEVWHCAIIKPLPNAIRKMMYGLPDLRERCEKRECREWQEKGARGCALEWSGQQMLSTRPIFALSSPIRSIVYDIAAGYVFVCLFMGVMSVCIVVYASVWPARHLSLHLVLRCLMAIHATALLCRSFHMSLFLSVPFGLQKVCGGERGRRGRFSWSGFGLIASGIFLGFSFMLLSSFYRIICRFLWLLLQPWKGLRSSLLDSLTHIHISGFIAGNFPRHPTFLLLNCWPLQKRKRTIEVADVCAIVSLSVVNGSGSYPSHISYLV